jgi:hypothetical protein
LISPGGLALEARIDYLDGRGRKATAREADARCFFITEGCHIPDQVTSNRDGDIADEAFEHQDAKAVDI